MSVSRSWDRGSRAIGSALTFAVAVALFAWLGNLLDEVLGLSPLFLIVGAALGVTGGFIHVVNALAPDLLPFHKKRGRKDEPGSDTPADRSEP
jgi:F0F1-type ATP synthase assembly protein I